MGATVITESNSLLATSRREWRAWLRKNFKKADEVWLIYYKKETGKPRIAYNDAVEEALCFGWIDSTVRSVDDGRFAQRFTPRRPHSTYSQSNKVRLRSLILRKKVHRDVLAALGDIQNDSFVIPRDIQNAIQANKRAWKNFKRLSSNYKEIRIAYIDGARKRPKEFAKRLKNFIAMTEAGRVIGFGGINRHY
ncbi:MAG: YdeI/OmpD-associated family protein [Spirochaetes bacterium]|nr:YdeI/OmpD-associated family protein [Spirochaetota bacterium]